MSTSALQNYLVHNIMRDSFQAPTTHSTSACRQGSHDLRPYLFFLEIIFHFWKFWKSAKNGKYGKNNWHFFHGFWRRRQAPGNVNDHHASVSELLCVKKRWVGRVSGQRCGEQQFNHKYFPQFPRKSTTFWDIRGNGKNTMEILSKKSPKKVCLPN